MRVQWCWRCKKDVPMLDEDEHARLWSAYQRSRQRLSPTIEAATRLEGQTAILPHPSTIPSDLIFWSVEDEYEKITGARNVTTHALHHHRISRYGPPCLACGKPLRTATARSCAACGVSSSSAG